MLRCTIVSNGTRLVAWVDPADVVMFTVLNDEQTSVMLRNGHTFVIADPVRQFVLDVATVKQNDRERN